MGLRTDLQVLLENLLGSGNVYFQAPSNLQMSYPCIIYTRDSANTKYADNASYSFIKRYMVTVIDKNPDSQIPDMLAALPMCSFSRHYTAENLNHDVFTLYF